MDLKVVVGSVLAAGALWVFHKWGRPVLKKLLDDPNTSEDESLKYSNVAEEVIKLAVDAAVAKGLSAASKNPKVDAATHALESLTTDLAGQISTEDAKKLVNAALKGK